TAIVDRVSRSGPGDHWRSLQRFRRPRAGRRSRDRRDRAPTIRRYLSDYGQSRGERLACASFLQMGCAGSSEGGPALELPQISDRPRRPYRRSLPRDRRTFGHADQDSYRAAARRDPTWYFSAWVNLLTDKSAGGDKIHCPAGAGTT